MRKSPFFLHLHMCIFLLIPCKVWNNLFPSLYNSLAASPPHSHTQPPNNPKSFSLAVQSWATLAPTVFFLLTFFSFFWYILLFFLFVTSVTVVFFGTVNQRSTSFHSPQISDGEFLSSPPSFSNILQKLLVFSPVRLSNSNCCVGDVTQDAPWVIRRVSLIKKILCFLLFC